MSAGGGLRWVFSKARADVCMACSGGRACIAQWQSISLVNWRSRVQSPVARCDLRCQPWAQEVPHSAHWLFGLVYHELNLRNLVLSRVLATFVQNGHCQVLQIFCQSVLQIWPFLARRSRYSRVLATLSGMAFAWAGLEGLVSAPKCAKKTRLWQIFGKSVLHMWLLLVLATLVFENVGCGSVFPSGLEGFSSIALLLASCMFIPGFANLGLFELSFTFFWGGFVLTPPLSVSSVLSLFFFCSLRFLATSSFVWSVSALVSVFSFSSLIPFLSGLFLLFAPLLVLLPLSLRMWAAAFLAYLSG